MAKIKLLERHRLVLQTLAGDTIKPRAELAALEKAYAKAMPIVKKIVEARYPSADMAVLAKYEMSRPDQCVRLQFTTGGVDEFQFAKTDAPIVPGSRHFHGCQNRIYLADEKATTAVQPWIAARNAYKEECKARLRDYYALIAAARTTEDIIAVWPEAKEHLPKGQELVAVNAEVLARIKADQKERAKAA